MLGPVLQGADMPTLISALRKASGGPKSEYETWVDFKARISKVPDNLRNAMVFPLSSGAGHSFTYNAELSEMLVTVGLDTRMYDGIIPLSTISVSRTLRPCPPFTASNLFGVTKSIACGSIEEQGISTQLDPIAVTTLSFKMTAEDARRMKPFLCLAISGIIVESLVYHLSQQHEPTMAEPNNFTISGDYIRVYPSHVMVMDIRSGHLIAAIPVRR